MSSPVELVREYVRAHRNRTLDPASGTTKSRPLGAIARELGLSSSQVREAMLANGWFQAVRDAEDAPHEAAPKVDTRGATKGAPTRATSTHRTKFNPHGWPE